MQRRTKKGIAWNNLDHREQQQAEKRQVILRTAAKIFARNGFHETTLDQIASALRITKPTVYYYFKDKDDLLLQITQSTLEELDRALTSCAALEMSGFEKLDKLVQIYGEFILTDIGASVTVLQNWNKSAPSHRRARALKREFDKRIRQVVEDACKDGSIAVRDPAMFTSALFGALNWAAQWFDPKGRLSAREVTEEIFDIFRQAAATKKVKPTRKRS